MRTRIVSAIVLGIFILSTSGCGYEVFNRKFVRKKKKPEGPPQIYHIQPFAKPPNAEIYTNAFLYWKTWENELLIALSPAGYPRAINNLKVKECLEHAVSSLNDMKNSLNDKKAAELDAYIKDLQKFDAMLEKQESADMALDRMKHDIEAHKRNVDIRFSLKAVKDDIRDDSSRPESN